MTWLAVSAAFVLTVCGVVVVSILRHRRRRGEIALREEPSVALEPVALEAPTGFVDTRPYDVRACAVQALEALAARESPVSLFAQETPTAEYPVALMAKDGVTTNDEFAAALMAKDGLTVSPAEVCLDTERGVQQSSSVHVVPRSPALTRRSQ